MKKLEIELWKTCMLMALILLIFSLKSLINFLVSLEIFFILVIPGFFELGLLVSSEFMIILMLIVGLVEGLLGLTLLMDLSRKGSEDNMSVKFLV